MKRAALGAGLMLAPMAWFASLAVSLTLAPVACGGPGKSVLWMVSAAALALAIASGLLALAQRKFHRGLAVSGAVLSVLFAVVIVAQAIPNLMLRGCE
jgi:hypothetical protein